jgi:hypothetical protein
LLLFNEELGQLLMERPGECVPLVGCLATMSLHLSDLEIPKHSSNPLSSVYPVKSFILYQNPPIVPQQVETYLQTMKQANRHRPTLTVELLTGILERMEPAIWESWRSPTFK